MLTRQQHNALAKALKSHGYTVERFDKDNSDVLDIWPKRRSLGFIEVTVAHAAPDYVVFCEVDYDGPPGLIEVFGDDVTPLVYRLNDFYKRGA